MNLGSGKLDHDWNKMFDFVAQLIKKYKGKNSKFLTKLEKPMSLKKRCKKMDFKTKGKV